MAEDRLYKISFFNQGQVYEIYAQQVSQGGLFGFIEIEGLVFGEKTHLVVDPGEERLQKEFEGVKRVYVPMHAVVRIDEVEKHGNARITPPPEGGGNVTSFPVPISRAGAHPGIPGTGSSAWRWTGSPGPWSTTRPRGPASTGTAPGPSSSRTTVPTWASPSA